MKILKFGGKSITSKVNIDRCIEIIIKAEVEERVIVIISAFEEVTNLLAEAANLAKSKSENYLAAFETVKELHINVVKENLKVAYQASVLSQSLRMLNDLETLLNSCFLLGELSPRSKDLILSYGEVLSSYIFSEILRCKEIDVTLVDSKSLIVTDEHYGRAVVKFDLTNNRIKNYFAISKQKYSIIPGFVASSLDGQVTTLGRGGSDYTAAIIASALDVTSLEIWTNVGGIFTADPHLVKQSKVIKQLSYEEAMEFSYFGAKVLYPPILQPLQTKNIPIYVKDIFNVDSVGTIIHNIQKEEEKVISGVSNIDNIALFTIEGAGMVGVTGFSRRLFDVFSREEINIIFITQASSEYSICFAISELDAPKAKSALEEEFKLEIDEHKLNPIEVELDLSIVAIIGDHMKNHQGISGKMFSTLGRNNINIRAIAQGASERNISTIISSKDVRKSLNVLHETFFEDNCVQLNLFIMGVGNVGTRFLRQITNQKKYLLENMKMNVRIVGLANSTKMSFNMDGFDLEKEEVPQILASGDSVANEAYFQRVKALNLRNSVFVDMTANAEVASSYSNYLRSSIGVVTCNKIACASDYSYYCKLKRQSRKYNAPFLFETCVGAGLPIIDTLNNLIASGDRIHKIQAVLSGSLNFIFNKLDQNTPFDEVVRRAQEEGFTEPNPLIDLSGVDVQRKLMILVREAGYEIELDEVENYSFLPDSCKSVINSDELYRKLKDNRSYFKALYEQACHEGGKLKFIASFENGFARVGIEIVKPDSDFYHLEGKDNIVLFFTDRYDEQPLLIKGAGAGASVTASGIFADVIRIGHKMI